MYRIIGADGKPYGPVSAEELRQWVREGRASGRTQVQTEGATTWQPLAALPEFADVFGGASQSAPPLTPSLMAAPPVTPPPNPDTLVAEVLARNATIDTGACLSRAWKLVTDRFWLCVGVGLVGTLLANVPFLYGVAYAGLFWFFLRCIRGEPAKFDDLFAPFSVAFLQCFLAIIPGLVLMALWTFTWPLLIDKRLEFWPAMEVSRRILWPNFWGILWLWIVSVCLMFVGLLCCYVGAFVAFPVIIAAHAYAYEDFFGRTHPALSPAAQTPVPAQRF
jgi:hypothetical protein